MSRLNKLWASLADVNVLERAGLWVQIVPTSEVKFWTDADSALRAQESKLSKWCWDCVLAPYTHRALTHMHYTRESTRM